VIPSRRRSRSRVRTHSTSGRALATPIAMAFHARSDPRCPSTTRRTTEESR
jgi:hypothetical protein